jgi:SAM-dependent methyltransferase
MNTLTRRADPRTYRWPREDRSLERQCALDLVVDSRILPLAEGSLSMPLVDYRAYWDKNIDKWGELYLDISHGAETLSGPVWFARTYQATLGRLERRLMAQRYALTIEFLDKHVRPGMVLSDLGCGTGLFVVHAVRRGATVNAIDFTPKALEITRANVERHCPDGNVRYHQLDVRKDEIPESDATLAMGLTPYLADITAFLENALPKTRLLYCLYIDPSHWANRVRGLLPFLNVRALRWYPRAMIDAEYRRLGWRLLERRRFASGYVDLATST